MQSILPVQRYSKVQNAASVPDLWTCRLYISCASTHFTKSKCSMCGAFFFTWFCFARSHDLLFHYLYFVAVLKDTQNQTTNARYVLRKTGEGNFQLFDQKGPKKHFNLWSFWKRTWELPEQLTCFWKFTLWPFFLRLKVQVDLNFEIKVGSVFSFWEVFNHRLSSWIKESIFFNDLPKGVKRVDEKKIEGWIANQILEVEVLTLRFRSVSEKYLT